MRKKCEKHTKKTPENIENEKKLKKAKKNSKRVWTNTFLCGKLWENLEWVSMYFPRRESNCLPKLLKKTTNYTQKRRCPVSMKKRGTEKR